jgi:hypothetical protein
MDYQAALLDPIYNTVGVPAVLTLFDGQEFTDLTVLDKSAGVDNGDGGVTVQTMVPAAVIRASELVANSIERTQLQNAVLEMNSTTWTVTSFKPKPSPKGELDGEVILFLKAKRTEGPL